MNGLLRESDLMHDFYWSAVITGALPLVAVAPHAGFDSVLINAVATAVGNNRIAVISNQLLGSGGLSFPFIDRMTVVLRVNPDTIPTLTINTLAPGTGFVHFMRGDVVKVLEIN